MDRVPLPAPYAVGTCVRYLGDMNAYADIELTKPIRVRGMVFEIIETKPGRRGSLRVLPDEYQSDEFDEPLRDTTTDGYSVYADHRGHTYLIRPDMVSEWEVVAALRKEG